MRLFVSVDLPDALAGDVRAVQEAFDGADGLNLTNPTNAHVTLKFLGEVDADRLEEVEEAVAAAVDDADVEPFGASFAGLGVFPSLDYISVVWLGVGEGSAEMTALHEAVEERTTALGFDPEGHDFTPHVTLGRLNHAGGKERVQEVVQGENPTVGRMRVEEVRLTKSDLGPNGPEYATVAGFPL